MGALGNPFSTRLNQRRKELGVTFALLAQWTGLSLRTVQRVLSGEETDPGFRTVASIAEALGVSLRFDADDAEAFRRKRAEQKAERVLALVQGTSALEAQALSEEAKRHIKERTVHELLAGSPRKLWAD